MNFQQLLSVSLVKSDYVNGVIEFLRTIFSYKKIYIVSGGDQKRID